MVDRPADNANQDISYPKSLASVSFYDSRNLFSKIFLYQIIKSIISYIKSLD